MLPLRVAPKASAELLDGVARDARVPVWLPAPMLAGWTVSGVAHAGDDRTGWRAVALACTGPAPLGGTADLVLVAEEPGVGLGARLAGLAGPDPGGDFDSPPHATVDAAGHETPLWTVPAGDSRCAYVGEAKGYWLWAVMWPVDAGYILVEHVVLQDLRDERLTGLLFGGPSPRLRP